MPLTVRKQLALLRSYVIVSSALFAILSFSAFQVSQTQRFSEITVERINVVEKDGTLRMVITSKGRSPAGTVRGKTFGPTGARGAGLVFYNDEGSENGGLGYSGKTDSLTYDAGITLAFDQYNQDQVVALQHLDNGKTRMHGLTFLDRPTIPIDSMIEMQQRIQQMPAGAERDAARREFVAMQKLPGNNSWAVPRLFVGRDRSTASVVTLNDPAGRTRIRMIVDSIGTPRLEFLDTAGKVTMQLPK